MSNSSFLLTKWYLDCVAENGDGAIFNVADIRWNTVCLHYGSLLTFRNGKTASASSLHGSDAPNIDGDTIVLKQPGLDIEGKWQALQPPVRRTVFQNAEGTVNWQCLQPMSQVELRLRGNVRLSGLGYADCLTMSLPPWQLSLSSIRWGRYLSPRDALVWIDRKGPGERQSVIHNGQEHHADSITESEVVFADGGARLQIDPGLVLRQGPLRETMFPGISRLAGLLPRAIFAMDECKWRSPGLLRTPAGESSGWVIHEIVEHKP